MVVLTLLGAGAYGSSWLFRYVTGTQSGVDRMAQPAAKGTAGTLTVTVRGVEVTPDFMKIKLAATNTSGLTYTLSFSHLFTVGPGPASLQIPDITLTQAG